MNEFRFQQWKVYKESKILFKLILDIYKKLPNDIKFSVGQQLIRSTLSITLNIAEGSGKQSDKELNRFFNIAIGSIYESVANLDILKDSSYIKEEKYLICLKLIKSIKKQLGGFKKKLKSC
jgi:four helix bundle protein